MNLSMAALEQCAHSPQVIALLNELQHQLSQRQPQLGEVLAVDLLNLNADDRHFINTLLGEGEVSVRIQQADDSESEVQEAIFCGLWRVRRRRGEKLLEATTGGRLRAAGVVAGGHAKSLADRFAVTAAH